MKIFILLFVVFLSDGQIAWDNTTIVFSSYDQCKAEVVRMHEIAHAKNIIPADAELVAHCVEFVKLPRS